MYTIAKAKHVHSNFRKKNWKRLFSMDRYMTISWRDIPAMGAFIGHRMYEYRVVNNSRYDDNKPVLLSMVILNDQVAYYYMKY